MNQEKLWTKDYLFISLNNFFTFLSFYVLATAFPLFVKEVMNGNGQQIGLVITIFVIGNIGIRPFAGLWVDRYGAKKILVIGFALFSAISLAYLSATTLIYLLFALRFLHGLSHGLATTASNTLVTKLIPENKLGQGIGYFSMFMSISMVIGPALGIYIWEKHGETGLLWCGAIIGLCSFFFAFFTKGKMEKPKMHLKKKLEVKDFFEVKALPASILVLLLAFSYSSLTSFLSIFAKENELSHFTSLFFVVFALFILIPRPIVGKIFDKDGPNKLVIIAIISFTIGMMILSKTESGTLLLIAAAFMGLGHGILVPAYQTIAMNAVSAERRGIAAATYFMLFDVGYGLGSYLLGIISNSTGYRTMFMISACIVLLSAVVFRFIISSSNKHDAYA